MLNQDRVSAVYPAGGIQGLEGAGSAAFRKPQTNSGVEKEQIIRPGAFWPRRRWR